MDVIPAIDIRGGRCVRLYQGDYRRETVFGDDPVRVALRWQELGAPRLHVVDLDGAKEGRAAQRGLIAGIAAAVSIPVQVGGGVRGAEEARSYLAAGVDRVVVGTAAVEAPGLVARLVEELGDRLIVGIDARRGRVATAGWTVTTAVPATELAQRMEAAGVRRFIFTEIGRDGTLAGPDTDALRDFVAATRCAVIASGGVARIEDIAAIAKCGVEAVIVGRALYARSVTLEEAMRAAQKREC